MARVRGGFTVYFSFKASDFRRWLYATQKLESIVRYWARRLPQTLATQYAENVKRNIMRQKFMGAYQPYVTRYAYWKAQNFPSFRYWYLAGDLYNNIKAFPVRGGRAGVGSTWMGGIPSGITSAGKSWKGTPSKPLGKAKSIAMYGYVMEYGGSFGSGGVHPPRPIFTPTYWEFARKDWYKGHDKAASRMIQSWS
jgi:hypothetical protein